MYFQSWLERLIRQILTTGLTYIFYFLFLIGISKRIKKLCTPFLAFGFCVWVYMKQAMFSIALSNEAYRRKIFFYCIKFFDSSDIVKLIWALEDLHQFSFCIKLHALRYLMNDNIANTRIEATWALTLLSLFMSQFMPIIIIVKHKMVLQLLVQESKKMYLHII